MKDYESYEGLWKSMKGSESYESYESYEWLWKLWNPMKGYESYESTMKF